MALLLRSRVGDKPDFMPEIRRALRENHFNGFEIDMNPNH